MKPANLPRKMDGGFMWMGQRLNHKKIAGVKLAETIRARVEVVRNTKNVVVKQYS